MAWARAPKRSPGPCRSMRTRCDGCCRRKPRSRSSRVPRACRGWLPCAAPGPPAGTATIPIGCRIDLPAPTRADPSCGPDSLGSGADWLGGDTAWGRASGRSSVPRPRPRRTRPAPGGRRDEPRRGVHVGKRARRVQPDCTCARSSIPLTSTSVPTSVPQGPRRHRLASRLPEPSSVSRRLAAPAIAPATSVKLTGSRSGHRCSRAASLLAGCGPIPPSTAQGSSVPSSSPRWAGCPRPRSLDRRSGPPSAPGP